jgi:ribonucleotide monophosphatase NagD (HAD superfamily)
MTAGFDAAAMLATAALAAGSPVVIEAEGALWDGQAPLPGAQPLLARLGHRAGIVSNQARETAPQYAARLAAAGLALPRERILAAGPAAVAAAATRFAGQRVLLLAPRGLLAAARALGLDAVAEAGAAPPAALVLADDTDLTWARLAAAAAALAAGVPCLAASAEARGSDGAPGPGAVVAALRAAVPAATIELLGLPNPALLRHAAARAGGTGPGVLIATASRAEAAQQAGMHLFPADQARALAAAGALPG